jgi:hypothetical protein
VEPIPFLSCTSKEQRENPGLITHVTKWVCATLNLSGLVKTVRKRGHGVRQHGHTWARYAVILQLSVALMPIYCSRYHDSMVSARIFTRPPAHKSIATRAKDAQGDARQCCSAGPFSSSVAICQTLQYNPTCTDTEFRQSPDNAQSPANVSLSSPQPGHLAYLPARAHQSRVIAALAMRCRGAPAALFLPIRTPSPLTRQSSSTLPISQRGKSPSLGGRAPFRAPSVDPSIRTGAMPWEPDFRGS